MFSSVSAPATNASEIPVIHTSELRMTDQVVVVKKNFIYGFRYWNIYETPRAEIKVTVAIKNS